MTEHAGVRLLSVNVVHELIRGPSRWTAIDKRPVRGPVEVGSRGLVGDKQCDTRHHGGPEKAVYAYASEDAAWWAEELDREIPPGLFGENLTTVGLDVSGARIGERWRIGTAQFEVRSARIACSNVAARMGIPKFHRRFTVAQRPGAYLAVLTPGVVCAGDAITVEHRPDDGATIGDPGAPRREPKIMGKLVALERQ